MRRSSFLSLALVTSIVSLSSTALARDSTWLLCKGVATHGAGKDAEKVHVVANLLEHRSQDGSSRDLGVTLIYGDQVSHGAVLGKNGDDAAVKGSTVKLASIRKPTAVVYSGGAELAGDMKTFTLKGSVDWSFGDDDKATMEPFSAKLACVEQPNP